MSIRPDHQAPAEPLFLAVREDAEVQRAHATAAATMDDFTARAERDGDRICAAKLRFRDPDESEKTGRECLAYIWLTNVEYDAASNTYVGMFFEVPVEFSKWHQVGQWLRFEKDDVFDWFVNDQGVLHGGFTLRVARSRLPTHEQEEYDNYLGVKEWAEAPQ